MVNIYAPKIVKRVAITFRYLNLNLNLNLLLKIYLRIQHNVQTQESLLIWKSPIKLNGISNLPISLIDNDHTIEVY